MFDVFWVFITAKLVLMRQPSMRLKHKVREGPHIILIIVLLNKKRYMVSTYLCYVS